MAFRKINLSQVQTGSTAITDPLMSLNSQETGSNSNDLGLILERGSDTNVSFIWDESEDHFALINTTEDGTTDGSITVSGYEDLKLANITATTNITSDTINATSGFIGNLTGNVTGSTTGINYGNVTSTVGTSTFNNVTLSGNLIVNGSTTTVSSTNTTLADNLLELNTGAGSNDADSGIIIERGTTGDNAFMGWDESSDSFILGTTTATGSSIGNLTITPTTLQIGSLEVAGGISLSASDPRLDFTDTDNSLIAHISANNGNLTYQTHNSNRHHIFNNGNVGIGTSSPGSYKLNVNGQSNFSGNINLTSTSTLLWNGGDVGITNSGTNLVFKTYTGSSLDEAMRITSSGNVGIGASDTSLFNVTGGEAKLVVTGSSTDTNIAANVDASIVISNTSTAAGNTSGLHFARADTDDTPNYAGASIVAQFPDAQVTGQYPRGELAFLTSNSANTAPTEAMRVRGDLVGIGTTAPSEVLHVIGNILASGDVTAYSDERLKDNIQTIDGALGKVNSMRGVTYTKDGLESSGVIAQEIEEIAPELVKDGEYKSVAYGNLVGYLIEAIKEQQIQIEQSKTEIENLKKLIGE